jgi:hypothetical protein
MLKWPISKPQKSNMKPGDKTTCPECGEETFSKLKPVLDGWTKIGNILICGLCEHKLCDYEPETMELHSAQPNAKTSALADLLGGVKIEKPVITVSDEERQFCRDCQHFVVHPFLSRCDLHDKNVNPMDDCAEFQKKLTRVP